jgi:mannose PTS system EIID component
VGRLTGRDLARMARRTLLLQATFNYERQQGLGWAWALAPALRRLYPDPEQYRARLAEHTAYFNTQPTLASLALGAVAGMEEQRAASGDPEADGIARVKGVLGASLAALGDRFYWFTLRPFAASLGVLVALLHGWWGALALWAAYNTLHLGVRFAGVRWGYVQGPAVLGEPLRLKFGRFATGLCVLGSAVLGLVTAWLLVPAGQPRPLAAEAAIAAGIGVGLVAAQRSRPSPTEWALGAGVLCMIAAWRG